MLAFTILLVFVLTAFLLSGLDDLAIDLVYWQRRLGDRQTRGRQLAATDLDDFPQMPVAVLTATWHEYDVIAQMLRFNDARIDYSNYEFIVGTYPNDPRTQAAVDEARRNVPRVTKAVNPRPGPTNKADCLNAAYAEMERREAERGERFAFVVLHDPEDVMHPLEFKLYNRIFTTRADIDMVQTPIYPFKAGIWEFTAGAYMDEFAEQHTKNLYAREWASSFIPSAGVGTAMRRSAVERMAEGGQPFGTHSLTEDYEIGLKMAVQGMRAVFVRQMLRVVDDAGLEGVEVVTTRAHFPHTFRTAVRQRTRWILGIVFQSNEKWGWVGNWRVRWMLFHDRKGPWSYATVSSGYLIVLYVLGYLGSRSLWFPEWDVPIPGGVLKWALRGSLALMMHRMVQQVISTSRVYGWRQGLMSIVRHPWATVINLTATVRAFSQFRRSQRDDAILGWDKTQHYVPRQVHTS